MSKTELVRRSPASKCELVGDCVHSNIGKFPSNYLEEMTLKQYWNSPVAKSVSDERSQ
jgi:hypothetical protein